MENYTLLQFMKKNFIGKRIKITGGSRQKTVIGVVKNVKWRSGIKYDDAGLDFVVKDEQTNRLNYICCYPFTKIEELLSLY